MAKHLSVLMLFIRSSLYKFLLIVLAMAAAESLLFLRAFNSASGYFGLDTILRSSRLELVFGLCFLLVCALLCLVGCNFGSKLNYTLDRVRVTRRAVFLWQAANNAGFLIMFLAAQIGLALAFCGIYTAQYPQPQATMLVFYTSDFLHSLLPLADTGRIICNCLLLLALAFTSACFPIRMRRGERPSAFIVVALLCFLFFVRNTGQLAGAVMLTIASLVIAWFATAVAWEEPNDA